MPHQKRMKDKYTAKVSRKAMTSNTSDANFEVDWDEDDPQNPLNWSTWYKGYIIGTLSWSTLV